MWTGSSLVKVPSRWSRHFIFIYVRADALLFLHFAASLPRVILRYFVKLTIQNTLRAIFVFRPGPPEPRLIYRKIHSDASEYPGTTGIFLIVG